MWKIHVIVKKELGLLVFKCKENELHISFIKLKNK